MKVKHKYSKSSILAIVIISFGTIWPVSFSPFTSQSSVEPIRSDRTFVVDLLLLVVHLRLVPPSFSAGPWASVRRIKQWISNARVLNPMTFSFFLNTLEWSSMSMVAVKVPTLVFFNFLKRKIISTNFTNAFVFIRLSIGAPKHRSLSFLPNLFDKQAKRLKTDRKIWIETDAAFLSFSLCFVQNVSDDDYWKFLVILYTHTHTNTHKHTYTYIYIYIHIYIYWFISILSFVWKIYRL